MSSKRNLSAKRRKEQQARKVANGAEKNEQQTRKVADGAKKEIAASGEDKKQESSTDEAISVAELLIQLELAQITKLARAGHYADAERLLTSLLNVRELPAALDLQARMHAQQGRFNEARECWKNALLLDPKNADYAAGIRRLGAVQPLSQRTSASPFSPEAAQIAVAVGSNDLLLARPERDGWRYDVVPGYMVRHHARGGGHDYLLYRLARCLGDYVEANKLGIITLSQAGYEVTLPDEPSTIWVPDLAFVRAERVPAASSSAWLRPWKLVPDLVVEIVAGQQDVDQLVQGWLGRGVRLLWLIWPGSRVVDVWQAGSQASAPMRARDTLNGLDVLPGFTCTLDDLFSAPRNLV